MTDLTAATALIVSQSTKKIAHTPRVGDLECRHSNRRETLWWETYRNTPEGVPCSRYTTIVSSVTMIPTESKSMNLGSSGSTFSR